MIEKQDQNLPVRRVMLNTNPKVARLMYCALPALKVVHMEGVGTRATQMLCGWLMWVTIAQQQGVWHYFYFFWYNDEYSRPPLFLKKCHTTYAWKTETSTFHWSCRPRPLAAGISIPSKLVCAGGWCTASHPNPNCTHFQSMSWAMISSNFFFSLSHTPIYVGNCSFGGKGMAPW